MNRCLLCGGSQMVTVSGRAARAAFPGGRRCAFFFSPWHPSRLRLLAR